MKNAPDLFNHPIYRNLFGAAALWLLIAVSVCYGHGQSLFPQEAGWTIGIWALCTLGLIALGKLLAGVLNLASGPVVNRLSHLVQTSVWILIKLACFLILNAILVKSASVPRLAILLGFGTLGVVPLLSGLTWSWLSPEEFQHA